ncbi:Hypothetical_protein [Hexamita inflata]|uniref:Hypothetical_protein n=1 Tax=Hexamita inflata TaxID=28002 RepID=A0ABP1GWH6_9EUKA
MIQIVLTFSICVLKHMLYYSSPSLKDASQVCSNKLIIDNQIICYCFRGDSIMQYSGQIDYQMDVPFYGAILTGGKQFRNVNISIFVKSNQNLKKFSIQYISDQSVFIECQFKVRVNDSLQQSSLMSGFGELKLFHCDLLFNSTSLITSGLIHTSIYLTVNHSSLYLDINGSSTAVIANTAYNKVILQNLKLLGVVHTQASQLIFTSKGINIVLTNITKNINVVKIVLNGPSNKTGNMQLNIPEPVCETPFRVHPIESLMVSADSSVQTANPLSGETVFNNLAIFDATISFTSGWTTSNSFSLFGESVKQFYKLKIVSQGPVEVGSGALLSQASGVYFNMIIIQMFAQLTINGQFSFLQNIVNVQSQIINLKINSRVQCVGAGQFALIQTVTGVQVTIKMFQVNGQYTSTQSSCLGIHNVADNSQIIIQYAEIAPEIIQVGNMSSFILVSVQNSNVQIERILLQFGQQNNLISITTCESMQLQQFLFGGLVLQSLQFSVFMISNVSVLQYYDISTQVVKNSGIFIGSTQGNPNVQIKKICFSLQIKLQTALTFGILGDIMGTFNIQDIILDIAYNPFFARQKIGFIGNIQNSQLQFTNINVKQCGITEQQDNGINQMFSAGVFIGAVSSASTIEFNFIHVENCNLQINSQAGCISGFVLNSSLLIQNIIVTQSQILSDLCAGYIVGNSIQGGNLTVIGFHIDNSIITQLVASQYVGGLIGNFSGPSSISQVTQLQHQSRDNRLLRFNTQ